MSAAWPLPDDAFYREEARDRLGAELAERFARVRLLILDCDGVLTSADLHYGAEGEVMKVFDARDGLGLMIAREAGLKRALLTGRDSAPAARRCRDLKFESIKLGRLAKLPALDEILAETGCAAESALYMGDDLLDLPPMSRVGLSATVPGAPLEVRRAADLVTRAAGGRGAVREVCELILKSQGRFREAALRLAGAAEAAAPDEERS